MTLTYHKQDTNLDIVHELREFFDLHLTDLQIEDPRGYLKISSDGTKMVSANARSGLYLYDFDANTGMLSNQERIDITSANIASMTA